MSKNQLQGKVKILQKKVEDRETIRTFADLVSWEEDNKHTMNRPKIAKPLLKQLQEAGLYLDL